MGGNPEAQKFHLLQLHTPLKLTLLHCLLEQHLLLQQSNQMSMLGLLTIEQTQLTQSIK